MTNSHEDCPPIYGNAGFRIDFRFCHKTNARSITNHVRISA
jgi:hypothetical protein